MKTTYLKNKLLEHITGVATFTKPTNTYLALFRDDPTVDGDLTKEITGGSYAREQLDWGTAADGLLAIDGLAEINDLPATTIKYWGICDASTNGHLLEYFALERPMKVASGADFSVDASNLVLREG